MNLLLLEPSELGADRRAVLTDDRARHLLSVLGVVPGQDVRVGVVNGGVGVARVVSVEGGRVSLECAIGAAPPAPGVDLLLAVPRPKVLRRLWAQVAALGVRRIMLTNAARVERNYFDTHVLEPRGYRALLIEGLQQARDTRLPLVSVHRQFRILVEDQLDELSGPSLRLLADPGATICVSKVVPAGTDRVLLAVGPEGGWNDFERNLLRDRGFVDVDLGPRTLRSDTACVALLAIVHDVLRRNERATQGPLAGL